MPWASPFQPSIQLGCLKAYLDKTLGAQSKVNIYSAFFSIPHYFKGDGMWTLEDWEDIQESVYFLIFLKTFILPKAVQHSPQWKKIISLLSKICYKKKIIL